MIMIIETLGVRPASQRKEKTMAAENSGGNGGDAGVTFFGLLTIAFIVLKLTKVINWSWVWVLAPLWIPTCVIVFVVVLIILIGNWK